MLFEFKLIVLFLGSGFCDRLQSQHLGLVLLETLPVGAVIIHTRVHKYTHDLRINVKTTTMHRERSQRRNN